MGDDTNHVGLFNHATSNDRSATLRMLRPAKTRQIQWFYHDMYLSRAWVTQELLLAQELHKVA
jgi:hypothetical protein